MCRLQDGTFEVEQRLVQWASYRLRLDNNEIGWPSKSVMIKLSEGCGTRYPTTGVCLIGEYDLSAQTDYWLQCMGREFPEYRDAIQIYYTTKMHPNKVAKLLGISRRTLNQRIQTAKIWLCGRLASHRDAQAKSSAD